MLMKFKIRRGDKVIVLTGKEKGKISSVKIMDKKNNRAIVEGLNYVTFCKKGSESGLSRKESYIHISNLAHVDPKDGKATRVGVKYENGNKFLFSKRTGEVIR